MNAQSFFERHALPIGVQLFPLIPQLQQDFEGTLAALAEIGFGTVELSGFHGRDPAALRAALDRAGLACSGVHVQGRGRGSDENLSGDLNALIAKLHTLGATTVLMPIFRFPERFEVRAGTVEELVASIRHIGGEMTADDWKWNADFLNATGNALAKEGIQLGYHNHNFEFAPSGSTSGLEILLDHTDPALVTFELDTGWAVAAGIDPIALMQAHPGRFGMIHMKDLKPTTPRNYSLGIEPTEVGSGVIDWHALLPAAYAAGTRRFFIEQEAPFERPALEAMRIGYDYLSRI